MLLRECRSEHRAVRRLRVAGAQRDFTSLKAQTKLRLECKGLIGLEFAGG